MCADDLDNSNSPTVRPGRRPVSRVPVAVARSLRQSMPPQEVRLWMRLRRLRATGLHFHRQVPIGNFVVDFACLKHHLVIEVDGGQHNAPDHAARDQSRDHVLRKAGYRVLRFWNSDVQADIDSVIETIIARIEGRE